MKEISPFTIKPFLDDQFLLENTTAETLYHEYAKDLPIIDYHCHLSPAEIREDRQFENLTKVWLDGDHYKWRAMRTFGIDEQFITGSADDREKFRQWAKTVPFTIRNPLFHWTHLELKRYFDVNGLLNPTSADAIYDECTSLLHTPAYSARNIIRKMNVEVVCTTDDPLDDLAHHKQLVKEGYEVKVLPAFRPDKAILIEQPNFVDYIGQLAKVVGFEIQDYSDLLDALNQRATYFHDHGCRLSDHGLENMYHSPFTFQEVDNIFKKRMAGKEIFHGEAVQFMSGLLFELGCMYHDRGWVQQFHLGALRNNNTRMREKLGPDTGFDSIGDFSQARALSSYLNGLDEEDRLTQTIIYNLNPADNEVMATMIGNFNDGSVRGKMQFGSAWWFLDQKDGMEKQLNALSNMGLLSCFIGMLTDSRSFLSYPRHEYFRRLVCNMIGKDVHNGELPHDLEWLGGIVQDICYKNAKNYFKF